MKKHLICLALFFITATQSQEKAQEKPAPEGCWPDKKHFYASFFSGPNFIQNTSIDGNKASYDTGYIVAGSLGFSYRFGLHFEAEYAFRRNSIDEINLVGMGSSDTGRTQVSSYMANLLWGLPKGCTFWCIQPFIGGGLGYDFQQMHTSTSRIIFNQKWYNFSWQLMAGFARPIFRNTELAIEYKFHQGGTDFYNHAIGLSLQYNFGYLK